MAKSRGDELQDVHNKGQPDGSAGKRDFPRLDPDSVTGSFLTIFWSNREVQELREDKEAYDKGHENGRKQR